MRFLPGLAACLFMTLPAVAQSQNAVGQWQCEYATRNIYRTDAHAVHYQAVFSVLPNGTFQAQGNDPSMGGPFQAQGQWQLQQDQQGLWFAARGQRTSSMMGMIPFAFDSYLVGPAQMLLNVQDAGSGVEVASACQRIG